MSLLLDTNVLLRTAEPTHPQHRSAQAALDLLLQRAERVHIVPQVLYEYWVVATRPLNANGIGLSTGIVQAEIERFLVLFSMLHDDHRIFAYWKALVAAYDIKGKPAHDARLVAAMKAHQIDAILTFNESDFVRFSDITVLTPDRVLAS